MNQPTNNFLIKAILLPRNQLRNNFLIEIWRDTSRVALHTKPINIGETESLKHCIIYPSKPVAGEVEYVKSFIVVASTRGIFVGLSSSVYDFDEERSTSL
jgi:hypothetical protein